jgi:hypothetical protein
MDARRFHLRFARRRIERVAVLVLAGMLAAGLWQAFGRGWPQGAGR